LVINTNVDKLILGTKDDGQPFNILVVDDSAFMVKTINKMLTNFGCEVVATAANGEEAIAKLQQNAATVDIVTLDISMPKMDGLTALPELIKAKPGVKVIMVSAMGDKDKVKQAIISGAKHFIVKPFKAEKVFDIMKWVIEK
jgi:two-component system, chemotaxis family, chemotaxis protein CheY